MGSGPLAGADSCATARGASAPAARLTASATRATNIIRLLDMDTHFLRNDFAKSMVDFTLSLSGSPQSKQKSMKALISCLSYPSYLSYFRPPSPRPRVRQSASYTRLLRRRRRDSRLRTEFAQRWGRPAHEPT